MNVGSVIKQSSYVCVLVGSKSICEEVLGLLKLVDTPDRILIEGDFEVEPSLDRGLLMNFNVEQIAQEIGELKLTLKFDRTGGQTNFISTFVSPALDENSLLMVTVFGSVKLNRFFQVPRRLTIGFLVVSNDLSQDTAVIYVKGRLTRSSIIQFNV